MFFLKKPSLVVNMNNATFLGGNSMNIISSGNKNPIFSFPIPRYYLNQIIAENVTNSNKFIKNEIATRKP